MNINHIFFKTLKTVVETLDRDELGPSQIIHKQHIVIWLGLIFNSISFRC